MRFRKPVLLVCLALIPMLGIFLAIQLYSPLELVYTGQELSGIMDDKGDEAILLTLTLSNRSSTRLYFPREQWVDVEALRGREWTSSLNKCSLSYLMPHKGSQLLVAVPPGTELCRLRVKHAPPTFRERAFNAWFRYKLSGRPPKWLMNYDDPKKRMFTWTASTLKAPIPRENPARPQAPAPSPAASPSKS